MRHPSLHMTDKAYSDRGNDTFQTWVVFLFLEAVEKESSGESLLLARVITQHFVSGLPHLCALVAHFEMVFHTLVPTKSFPQITWISSVGSLGHTPRATSPCTSSNDKNR